MRTVTMIAVILAAAVVSPRHARAQAIGGEDAGGESAVEAARQALGSSAEYPWYDADSDAIRSIEVRAPQDVAARKSNRQAANRAGPTWGSGMLQILGWVVLGLVVVALVWALIQALITVTGGWRSGPATSLDAGPLHGDIDRIESLPFQLQGSQVDLLGQARRFYESGEFSQAIVYLYSYQLIQLDRHQLIRLAKGKTNRQYLREVRSRSELWRLLSRSMVAFEDVFFGHHQLDSVRFESCWRQLDEFHQQLGQAAA